MRDYRGVLGKTLVAWNLEGYRRLSGEMLVESPACLIRVVTTLESDIHRWVDDNLDPKWNVVLIKPESDKYLNDYHEFWVYGYSRHLDGRVEKPEFEPLDDWKLKVATPGYEMTPQDEAAFKLLEGYDTDTEMEES